MRLVNAQERLAAAQRLHQGVGGPKDIDAAETIYNEVLNKNIGNPHVLYCLGTLHMERGHFGLAIQILGQVTSQAPDFGEAWNNLGMAFRGEHMLDAADQAFEQAERRLPEIADIPSNRAGIRINAGGPGEALSFARRALEIEPTHNQARFHKALALLELQRWNEAWDAHEARLDETARPGEDGIAQRNYHGAAGTTPLWDGRSKARVVVHGEEGLGDEIMFASCIADAQESGAELIIEPNPRLHTLFERSFPLAKVHGTHATDGGDWIPRWGRPDCKIAIGSLPKFYRRSERHFPRTPYLKADPEKGRAMRARLPESGRKRIGISWQGGVGKTHVHLRSLPLPRLKPLLEHDVDWISVQYTPDASAEIAALRSETGFEVHHWPEVVEAPADYDETAALVSSLDLVITACQSVLHLCGALGVPCWVLTPSKPDWRLGLERDHMAWYGDWVRLYRQGDGEDWGPAIERVAADLRVFTRKEAA